MKYSDPGKLAGSSNLKAGGSEAETVRETIKISTL
jgi:hypothetical protein